MSKSAKQILSVLFHLGVLGGMVLGYDAFRGLATKLGFLKSDTSVTEESDFKGKSKR
ncbi:MAG: hypothetical protein H7Y36_10435 [Armatimonadetes bacterium]|nr:hypothetical protein [Akkermansiaceae bacterium]